MSAKPTPAVPSPPGPNERLTGQLRWLRPVVAGFVPMTLQQEWEDLATYEKTWRDVPVALVPKGEHT